MYRKRRETKKSRKEEEDMSDPPGSEESGAVGFSQWGESSPVVADKDQQDQMQHQIPPRTQTSRNGAAKLNIKYTIQDSGPYRIYVQLRNNDGSQGKLNKFSLGSTIRKLENFKGFIVDMKYVGRHKILVTVSNFIKANMLVDKLNEATEYHAFVPKHLVTIAGVIAGIPAHITEAEILEEIESEASVVEVRRLYRRNGKEEATVLNRVSVTFRTNELPERVKLFSCVTRVLPFFRKVDFCSHCLRYGHRTNNCKGARRCRKCGNRHEEEDEYEQCDNPVKCANCRSSTHTATSKDCPEKKIQENINAIRARKNLTYAEAREQCPVICQNKYDLLSDLQDYPLPAESFASAVKAKGATLREVWNKTNTMRSPIKPAVRLPEPAKPEEKGKKKGHKRRLSREEPTADAKENNKQVKNATQEPSNYVFVENPHKTTEKERVENLVKEAKRKTLENANAGFQEKIMKFYSTFMEQDLPKEVEDKFKAFAKEHFDLDKTFI